MGVVVVVVVVVVVHSLFQHMWDQPEMNATLETDEKIEIAASTVKCIYDQTCRKCGGLNRVIFYQPKDGRIQRKLRIEHSKGDTAAYIWNRQKEQRDKKQGEAPSTQTDKRPRDADSWSDQNWSYGQWWQQGSGSGSSGSRQWRPRRGQWPLSLHPTFHNGGTAYQFAYFFHSTGAGQMALLQQPPQRDVDRS